MIGSRPCGVCGCSFAVCRGHHPDRGEQVTGIPSGLGFGFGNLGAAFVGRFQREMDAQLEHRARAAQSRQISGNEILARQRAQGALYVQQGSAGAVEARETVRSEVLLFGQGRGQHGQPNMFNRWLDIRDSEDELHEFLSKCVAYGKIFQEPTSMSVKELDQ